MGLQLKLATATPVKGSDREAMPRFYFHLYNSADVADESGEELPDLEAARAYALSMARFEVSEAAKRDGRVVLSHHIDVEDENGAALATVTFGDAVNIAP